MQASFGSLANGHDVEPVDEIFVGFAVGHHGYLGHFQVAFQILQILFCLKRKKPLIPIKGFLLESHNNSICASGTGCFRRILLFTSPLTPRKAIHS